MIKFFKTKKTKIEIEFETQCCENNVETLKEAIEKLQTLESIEDNSKTEILFIVSINSCNSVHLQRQLELTFNEKQKFLKKLDNFSDNSEKIRQIKEILIK